MGASSRRQITREQDFSPKRAAPGGNSPVNEKRRHFKKLTALWLTFNVTARNRGFYIRSTFVNVNCVFTGR